MLCGLCCVLHPDAAICTGERPPEAGMIAREKPKPHMAADTPRHLLTLHITPTNRDDGQKPDDWLKPFRRPLREMSNWHGLIRTIPDQKRHKPLKNRISHSKSSNMPEMHEGLRTLRFNPRCHTHHSIRILHAQKYHRNQPDYIIPPDQETECLAADASYGVCITSVL